jgi:hypothetical protein
MKPNTEQDISTPNVVSLLRQWLEDVLLVKWIRIPFPAPFVNFFSEKLGCGL